jgi:structural maintenance of chromosome 1
MDAISFVLGLKAKDLRGSSAKDLVNSQAMADGGSGKGGVSLYYRMPDGSEKSFARHISPAGAYEYRVDDHHVRYEQYKSQLQSLGVLVDTQNFLVFQARLIPPSLRRIKCKCSKMSTRIAHRAT